MPEGDSIFRAARGLHRALAGRTVTRFASVFPHLTNPLEDRPLVGQVLDRPLVGQVLERVEPRGKHLLMWFSGGWVLRTHMRMHGSWHLYRHGERWQRPHHEMRIVLETAEIIAVAFNVPVAELETAATIDRSEPLRDLGPDLLRDDFDPAAAIARLRERGEVEIADALLDQRALAGIGNIYKSESLFAAGINPFTVVDRVPPAALDRVVAVAMKFLRANVGETATGMHTYGGFRPQRSAMRQTTGRLDPGARYWVYRRAGAPCRRCGTAIQRARQGPHARSTYWCPRCQPAADAVTATSRSDPDRD